MLRSIYVIAILTGLSTLVFAAEPVKQKALAGTDLFEAIKSGQVEAKFIPSNDQEAHLIVKNKTKEPLTIKLPEGLAGVPVVAQVVGGAANAVRTPQPVGGGYGGGLGGLGGLGGGAFNIPPEKVKNIKLECICLKHGAPDPSPYYPYEIQPIEKFTSDTTLQELLKLFATGSFDREAMQAAAWHVANDMSWDELANKQIRHINRPSEPYFSAVTLIAAKNLTTQAEQLAKQRPAKSPSETTATSSN